MASMISCSRRKIPLPRSRNLSQARDLLMPLRVAITYTRVSPPLFESMKILGLKECIERIDEAIRYLRGY